MTVEELRGRLYSGLMSESHAMSRSEASEIILPFEAAAEKQGEETYKAFIENNDTRRAAIATLSMQAQNAHDIGYREGLEQGRAEGEEQERKKIREAGVWVDSVDREHAIFGEGRYLVPASVLAPTKEAEHD